MKLKNSVIAIGNFDGFHMGHRKLVDKLKDIAEKKKGPCVILSFSPSPKLYFNKEFPLINTYDQRKEILRNYGVDEVIFLDFGKIMRLLPRIFVKTILLEQFDVKDLIVGFDFRFGRDRQGDVKLLKDFARQYNFCLHILGPVVLNNLRVSSTVIRDKIARGEFDNSLRKMLKREYYIDGNVIKGNGVGKEIGFPTMNISSNNQILPQGVFKTRVKIKEKYYDSITNIGYNPTFNRNEKSIEVHVINFTENVYHEQVRIFFIKKIRDEKKFKSRTALIRQIQKDILSMQS